ncbi:MAG: M23 family metallopeptidase, partial [Oscillospiraceae bacterium]|nr:M23 family metallopeptidase [Oscillospiraceae bacterium]
GEPAPDYDEEWDEEEEEEGRRFGFLGRLLLWLGLVLAIMGILLGAVLTMMYRTTGSEDIPEAALVLEGQALEPESYKWQVPVAGPFKKTFAQKGYGTPQQLETITVADPELTAAQDFQLEIAIFDSTGAPVFEGDANAYKQFAFDQDGDYTAAITARRTAGPNVSGHIPEGEYTYDLAFRLSAVPVLELNREEVVQGSAFSIKLSGVLGSEPPRLYCEFAPRATFVQRGSTWIALLDVPYNCPTGYYPIIVESGDNRLSQEVYIYARQLREVDTSTLDGTGSAFAPYLVGLPAGLTPYMEVSDPDIYWTTGFTQPVAGNLIRDYYVDEYTDRITDPTLKALVPDIVKAYNEAIKPRLSLNVTMELPPNTTVVSPADGRVIYTGVAGEGGRTMIIEHGGGLKSIFYLLSSYRAEEGDFVAKGSPIATTNHHIVCEMRLNGTTINPWDLWRNMSSLHTF